jgi:hypothetical protein
MDNAVGFVLLCGTILETFAAEKVFIFYFIGRGRDNSNLFVVELRKGIM